MPVGFTQAGRLHECGLNSTLGSSAKVGELAIGLVQMKDLVPDWQGNFFWDVISLTLNTLLYSSLCHIFWTVQVEQPYLSNVILAGIISTARRPIDC